MRNGYCWLSEAEIEEAISHDYTPRRRSGSDRNCPSFLDSIADIEAELDDIDEPEGRPNTVIVPRPRHWSPEDPDPTDPAPVAMAA